MTAEERLVVLEQELARAKRRWCWLTGAVGLAAASGLAVAAWLAVSGGLRWPSVEAPPAGPGPGELRANRFVLGVCPSNSLTASILISV